MKQEKPEKVRAESAKSAGLPPRDRVIRTALDLFYAHGVHSVGIDRIIAESGVAKMTFYRHFPSKSKLVAEYLARQDRAWQELLARFAGDESAPALERLLAIFDALAFACPATITNGSRRQLKLTPGDNYQPGSMFRGRNRCFSRREPRREAEPTGG